MQSRTKWMKRKKKPRPNQDLWNQAKVTSESTYGAGRRDAKKGMALDHEGICLSIRLR